MLLFPAIDLKDGQCVRLYKGDMARATVFSNDPAGQAHAFQSAGAEWLHVVDLNGAFAGKAVNAAAVHQIMEATTLRVQLGGGIRTIQEIAAWLDAGISRVVLGTVALKNPALVELACREFPDQVAVGIDAKGGRVAVQGWSEVSSMKAEDLALRFEDVGVAVIIYTNIDRDGAMEGPDIESTRALAEKISTPVIASGGVSGMEDLFALKSIETSGVIGVIAGRAIYDGKVDVKEAIKLLA